MGLKILVAEDDRHTRRILEHIFTKDPAFRDQKVQLFLAPDGEEALQMFEKETPDLVISDLLMPRLDGFALCRAIRKLPQGKDVPIIVTSAIYKETALLNRMRDELGVEFFAKPFQVRELVRGVQRMLEKRQRAAGLRPKEVSKAVRTSEFPKKGELAERPLAALLLDLLEEQATGVLMLRRGRVKKEIYVIHGHPVGAESNIRTETLGNYLVAKRVIDEHQHQQALTTAKEFKLSVMEAVAKLGWINESDIFRHHTALVKLKIINSLRWDEGAYHIAPGDTFSDRIPKATIDVVNILFLGLQRVTSLDDVSTKLDAVANRAVVPTERADRYREIFVKVFGDEVLRTLPTQPTINEMLSKGLEPLKVYIQTHVLLEVGMAKLGQEKERATQPPVASEDPIGLRQLRQAATKIPEPRSPEATADGLLYEEIFGVDEISVVTAMPVPDPAGASRRSEDSEEVAIDIQLDEVDVGQSPLNTAEARKLVVSTYLGIHDKNYYTILGVERTVPPTEIRSAYQELAEQFKVENFVDFDLGLDHPKLEEINQLIRQAFNVLIDPAKRAAYDEQLRERDAAPRLDPMEAEASFQQGQESLATGAPQRAVEQFRRALELDPESPDYQAALAWATFQAGKADPEVVRRSFEGLEQALAIDPDLITAHIYAGKIHAQTGNPGQAITFLQRALDLDPAHEEAFDEIARIHAGNGDWKLLERQHRKVLHRLAQRHPQRTVALWKSLATVYKEHLNDPESARMALEAAAGVAPDDPEIGFAIEELSRPDPLRWKETADALTARWSQNTADSGPLNELFKLYEQVEQYDAAYLVASLLVHQGAADAAATTIYKRFKPRFLIRARRDLDAEIWQRIRHPEDDPQTSTLFEVLATLGPDFDFEIPEPDHLAEAVGELPEEFARVLDYLCGLLQLPRPPVHQLTDPDRPPTELVRPIAPLLAVQPELLHSTNTLELGVHLSRLLPYFWAGRAFGVTMSTQQLRNVLMGAMKAVAPRLKVDDPSGAIGRIASRLKAAPAEVNTQLTEVMQSLTKERSSLNITRWMKGMARSADRLALVVTADLPTALSYISPQDQANAIPDLQTFCLTPEHLELRNLMATSVAV